MAAQDMFMSRLDIRRRPRHQQSERHRVEVGSSLGRSHGTYGGCGELAFVSVSGLATFEDTKGMRQRTCMLILMFAVSCAASLACLWQGYSVLILPPGRMSSDPAQITNSDFFFGKHSEIFASESRDPETWPVVWGSESDYKRTKYLGQGSFGVVSLATDLRTNTTVAIKVIDDIDPELVLREMDAMLSLKHENVLRLVNGFVSSNGSVALVFEALVDKVPTQEAGKSMSSEEVRLYGRKLFSALAHAQENGWVHRDIDPGNVLISPSSQQLVLIDWGMAVRFRGKEGDYRTNIGGDGFIAPEILLGEDEYDYSVDLWSAGVLFGTWVFGRDLLFSDGSTLESLQDMAKYLGSDGLYEFIDDRRIYFSPSRVLSIGNRSKQPLESLNARDDRAPDPDVIDLLSKIITWEPDNRISAKEALEHPYFMKTD